MKNRVIAGFMPVIHRIHGISSTVVVSTRIRDKTLQTVENVKKRRIPMGRSRRSLSDEAFV
jgi:hypothetical protein